MIATPAEPVGSIEPEPMSPPQVSTMAHRAVIALAVCCSLWPLYRLATAIGRGFDLTDEGLYLLSIQHPREALRSSTQFQLLVGSWWWLVPSVRVLRALKLVMLFGSSLLAVRATFDFLATRPGSQLAPSSTWNRQLSTIGVTLLAATPYIWLPQTPGYNEVSGVLACGIVACFMRLATDSASATFSNATRSALVAVGLLVWWLLLVKWPAGFLFAAAAVPIVTVTSQGSRRRATGHVAAGVAIGATWVQLASGSLWSTAAGIKAGSADLDDGYGTGELLSGYWHQMRDIAEHAVTDYFWLIALAVASAVGIGVRRVRPWPAVAIAGALPIVIATLALLGEFGAPIDQHARLLIIVVGAMIVQIVTAGVMAAARRDDGIRVDTTVLAAGIGLLAAPFAVAVGTLNPIFVNAAAVGAPLWGIGLVMIAAASAHVHGARLATSFGVLVLGFTTLYVGAEGTWNSPYRQPPLRAATEAISSGPLAGIEVDPARAAFLERIIEVVDDELVDDVIGVYKVPGAAAASGAIQPVHGWLPEDNPARVERALTAACAGGDRRILVILVDSDVEPDDVLRTCPNLEWTSLGVTQTHDAADARLWLGRSSSD